MILERIIREASSQGSAETEFLEWVQRLGYQTVGELESWWQENLFTNKTDVIVVAKVRKA